LSGNMTSRLALRVWKRLLSPEWWQAVLVGSLAWATADSLLVWVRTVLFLKTQLAYDSAEQLTFFWAEIIAIVLLFLGALKGLAAIITGLGNKGRFSED